MCPFCKLWKLLSVKSGKQPGTDKIRGEIYKWMESRLSRVSDPMLNPVPKSVHFLDYLNFGTLFDIFLWSMC